MSRPVLIATCLLLLPVYAVFLLAPVIYDTDHVADTLFAADIGWRVLSGAEPVLEFGHHYGGLFAEYVALGLRLSGGTLRGLDVATLLMAATALLACGLVGWKRLDATGAVLAFVYISALMLARAPVEIVTAITMPISTHSFVYNRFGIALLLVVALYGLVPQRLRWLEIAQGVAVGIIAVLMMLLKPSFPVVLPAIAVALLVQRRLWGVLAVAVGVGVGMLLLDPGFAKLAGSYAYAQSAVGDKLSFHGLAWKSVRMVLGQPLVPILAFAALGLAVAERRTGPVATLIAVLMLAGAGFGMILTMGAAGSIGQQLLMLAAAVAVALSARTVRAEAANRGLVTFCAAILVAGFALPQLANTVLAAVSAAGKAERVLFTQGPLRGYYVEPREGPDLYRLAREQEGEREGETRLDRLVSVVAEQRASGETFPKAGHRYVMLADGLRLLEALPDARTRRIAADFKISFSFALGAPPALAYPPWQWVTAPEFRDPSTMRDSIDIALVARHPDEESPLGDFARAAFRPCLQSPLWTLYLHPDQDRTVCREFGPDADPDADPETDGT